MLDEDGNMREVEQHQKYIMEDHEILYFDLPTIDVAEAHINTLFGNSHLDYHTKGGNIYQSSAELNAQMMVNKLDDWASKCNISIAAGSTVVN